MDIEEIVSISGQSGLFKVVAESRSGLIVESLDDKKRIPVFSTYKVSALKDISIYADNKDVPLEEIFEKIFEKEGGKKSLDHKSDKAELENYFEDILPEYDKERVYISDIKKVFNWYNTLQEAGMLKPSSKKESEGDKEEKETKSKTDTKVKKPATGSKEKGAKKDKTPAAAKAGKSTGKPKPSGAKSVNKPQTKNTRKG